MSTGAGAGTTGATIAATGSGSAAGGATAGGSGATGVAAAVDLDGGESTDCSETARATMPTSPHAAATSAIVRHRRAGVGAGGASVLRSFGAGAADAGGASVIATGGGGDDGAVTVTGSGVLSTLREGAVEGGPASFATLRSLPFASRS
ncbi:MAG: hypothetical protein JWO86_6059, partial [Myxococcaceae bacterium]|nr:hypothetical protein [Myxococcaceae bacterium]